jgi:hypothetical protein
MSMICRRTLAFGIGIGTGTGPKDLIDRAGEVSGGIIGKEWKEKRRIAGVVAYAYFVCLVFM